VPEAVNAESERGTQLMRRASVVARRAGKAVAVPRARRRRRGVYRK